MNFGNDIYCTAEQGKGQIYHMLSAIMLNTPYMIFFFKSIFVKVQKEHLHRIFGNKQITLYHSNYYN